MSGSEPSTHIALPPPQPLRSALKGSNTSPPIHTSHGLSHRTSFPLSPLPLPPSVLPPTPTTPHHAHSQSTASSSSQGQVQTPLYTPKVSFDTFDNASAPMFSYTLQVQVGGFVRSRQSRVFLCAASPDQSGRKALDWALAALLQDGDELVVFRGIDQDELDKDHEVVRAEARELMRQIQAKSVEHEPDRKLCIVLEVIAGKVTETLDRLIALYRPDALVVGTRGQRGMIQAWGAAFGAPGMGSVSKYCLSHSPVPIIVVRPESKVKKAAAKRRADPKRGTHFEGMPSSASLATPASPSTTR